MSAECGTYAAYQQHLRRGETPDPACRRAAADNARRSRERTGNRQGRIYSQARSRALAMLKEAHPVEFRMLLEAVEAEMRAARADS